MDNLIQILLIEDEPADAFLIKEMLQGNKNTGFKIDCVERLDECNNKLKDNKYNIILVDLGLPDSRGFETFTVVNSMAPNIPIIVLTGLSDEELGNRAVQSGAQDYLVKGEVNEVLLKRSVLYAIERKKAQEEIKKSEIRFREQSEQLTETNNLKDLLLDVMSHDLRNTAGVIFGFADLLKNREPENEIYDGIFTASESLLKVIDNTSTLAKLSYGQKIIMETLDMDQIIRESIQDFFPSGNTSYMQLEYKPVGKLPFKANSIVSEIIKNYISNAIKYGIEGKHVIINASIKKKNLVVSVTDFGETIPEEKRQLIFERFVRLNHQKYEGFGLGLAIVKRIADAHNGKVWVEPNQPHGNIFYFTMPTGL
ncbi:MAG: hybrid sensor histidine kinase/response regulator [Bacteroidales bacterium]|nr:hybrid sensor histidine kinase/response regulator [Bacteroidales bacterium]